MEEIAKIFKSGNSQAVRLPKKYRTSQKEFIIRRSGSSLILIPKGEQWNAFDESLSQFSEDFMEDGRNQPQNQQREEL